MKKILMNFYIIATMLLVSIVTTFATTDITKVDTTTVTTTATVASNFTVTIPKSIDISNETATYDIGVSGNLTSNEKLKVIPSKTFEMEDVNSMKKSVTATVKQEKTEWNYTDVSSSTGASGTINADLSAGVWSGTLAFNINMEREAIKDSNMVSGSKFQTKLGTYKANIETLSFIQSNNLIIENSINTIDLSEAQDASIIASIANSEKDGKYNVTIVSKGNVFANSDSSKLFYKFSSLTSLNLYNFNTSKVIDMSLMFSQCIKLESLNVSGFNTSEVINMSLMFQQCIKLNSLNVSNFNTPQLTNVSQMFDTCSSLMELNLSNFDASKISTSSKMFNNCSNLSSLNLLGWEKYIPNISFNYAMFDGCKPEIIPSWYTV